MPLTGTGPVLGAAILAAIDQAVAANPVTTPVQRQQIWTAVGNAIINHIVANGVAAVLVPSVSGVTPGPGVSGPGTGNLL